MKKSNIKVIWFNVLKNYGEGMDSKGNPVFIVGSAFRHPERIKPDMTIKAVLKKDQTRLYTFAG